MLHHCLLSFLHGHACVGGGRGEGGGVAQHFNMVQINDLVNNTWLHAVLVHQQRVKMVANGKTPQIHHNFGSLYLLK